MSPNANCHSASSSFEPSISTAALAIWSCVKAVWAEGLRKRFGKTEALRGVDLEVPRGGVFGLLGPNGAGKTTAVRILSTLPDAGRARVAGYDVVRDADRVRYRIGLAGQHASMDEKLSGRDNLRLFGRLYHLPPKVARRRADELLERFRPRRRGGPRTARTAPAGRVSRLRWPLTDGVTLIWRNLVQLKSQPGELVGALVFPAIMIVLFGYVFGSAIKVPGGGDYREYLLPGLFAMTTFMSVITTMLSVPLALYVRTRRLRYAGDRRSTRAGETLVRPVPGRRRSKPPRNLSGKRTAWARHLWKAGRRPPGRRSSPKVQAVVRRGEALRSR